MGVANPLEMQEMRETVKGHHVFDQGHYVKTMNFEASVYPKWMFKNGKEKLAEDEIAEVHLKEAGWSTEAPKQAVVKQED